MGTDDKKHYLSRICVYTIPFLTVTEYIWKIGVGMQELVEEMSSFISNSNKDDEFKMLHPSFRVK